MANESDPFVLKLGKDSSDIIQGAVIYDEHLKIGECLGQYTANGTSHKFSLVINRDNYGDLR